MKISIRAMTPADLPGFLELTALRPGLTRRDAEKRTEVIEHIAFRNPTADGAPTYFIATDGTRVLVHMGRQPTWFFVKGQRHLAAFAHDLFAHPELQATGQGFFPTMKLYKTVEDACPSFCGLVWTNAINVKLQQTRKYAQLWVQRWARPLDLEGKLGALPPPLRALGGWGSRAGIRALDVALGAVRRGGLVAERLDVLDERVDRLAERVGPTLGIAPIKTRDYLRWKYLDRPHLRATLLGVADGRELRGLVVLREHEAPHEATRVLDLVAHRDDGDAICALLAGAIEHGRRAGRPTVECLGTDPGVRRSLQAMLFRERPPEMPLFYLNGHKYSDPSWLGATAHWHHQFGDSEGGEVP